MFLDHELFKAVEYGGILGAVAGTISHFCGDAIAFLGEKCSGRMRAAEPAKPREPAKYRLVIEADDGWPLRSYEITPVAAAKLARDFDRERGTKPV